MSLALLLLHNEVCARFVLLWFLMFLYDWIIVNVSGFDASIGAVSCR